MERKITKCFSQRKADMTVTNDCSIVKDRCNMLHIDSLVSKAMMLFVFLTFSFATLAAKSHITDTRYDIEGVETGLQGTYLVKVYVYTKKSSVTRRNSSLPQSMELYSVVLRGKGLEHKNRSLTQRQKRNMQISSMLFSTMGTTPRTPGWSILWQIVSRSAKNTRWPQSFLFPKTNSEKHLKKRELYAV